jgi:hypothetical protein
MKKYTSKKSVSFILAFIILCLIALQIPFTRILGSSVKFTLFDFLAPTAGAFGGTLPGIIAVFLTQIINLLIHGVKGFDIALVIRLFPALFAVFYFSKKRTVNILIPIIAFIAFNLNPVGRSAWQYSLFWLIPIAANFFHKNLFARSVGATFTAHAVGGALWVWVFGLTREMWLALIPQVILERTAMAVGITVSALILGRLFSMLPKLISSVQPVAAHHTG